MGTANFIPPKMADAHYVLQEIEDEYELENIVDSIHLMAKNKFKDKYSINLVSEDKRDGREVLSIDHSIDLIDVSIVVKVMWGYYQGATLDMCLYVDNQNFTGDREGLLYTIEDLWEDGFIEDREVFRKTLQDWVDEVTEAMNVILGNNSDLTLMRVGTFSNGEAVYRERDSKTDY